MGVREMYEEEKKKKKENEGTLFYSAKNLYLSKNAEAVGKEISNRVNTWITNNNNYISNAQNRFSGNNTSYRTDSSDWLTTVTTQRENFQKEAESIKSVLTQYKDFFGDDYVKSVYEALDGNLKAQESVLDTATKDVEYWSQWANEGEYNDYRSGWLNPEAETNAETVALRKAKYQANAERIAEIEDLIGDNIFERSWNRLTKFALNPEQETKLYEEKEALKAENKQYEITQKVIDDYFVPETKEFLANAAYRDYHNASREELMAYNMAESDVSVALNSGGYYDAEGNIYDSNGKLVRAANSAPIVEDKLGLFLSADEDDIAWANNELLAGNGNYSNTWAQYIQEGEVNAWSYLKENEINIYYDLLKREGQEAAYRYLDAMQIELSRRATQETTDYINNAGALETVFLNIASVPMNIVGGPLAFLDDASNILTGEDINPYSGMHMFQNAASDIRDKTAEDLDKLTGGVSIPVIDFSVGDTYQALMSGADSLVGAAIGGTAYGVLMGMGSASSTAKDLYSKGASTEQIIAGSLLAGAAEMFFEKFSIDELVKSSDAKTIKNIIINMLKQGGVEATEEMATEIANTITNVAVMGSQSDWVDVETFIKNVVNAGLGGFISGGGMGGIYSTAQKVAYDNQVKKYGQSIIDAGGVADLQASAAKLSDNKAVAKLANKVAQKISAKNVGKLATTIQQVTEAKDISTIAADLENKGLSKKEAQKVAAFVVNTAQGYEADASEVAEIEKITDKLPEVSEISESNEVTDTATDEVAEYGKLLQSLDTEANPTTAVAPDTNVGHKATVAAEAKPAAENAQNVTENATAKEIPAEAKIEASDEVVDTDESTVTLEDASKKYGAQAGAMVATYTNGQDVAKYDAAYSAAYNMGKSGVALSYAMNSEATAYLTESQRELAHAAGADASSATAKAQAEANKTRANGKTGRRKGTVRGEGVKIEDLRKAFNDTQGKAYKLLTTYAEATGIDIVLYNSATNADGKFEGAQGKFKWSEDTIYIDINAGIADIGSVDDLAKYTMLRTFSHEFTHFIEKWNPVWYNEFRKVVFDTLTERGENVEALIETKQAQNEGMTYDKASREVVAEAMTDILPDANFVEDLANNHKTIFAKLLEKLKEFVADLKAYFSSLDPNSSREANALKEQIGESVKYVENIVKLFDKVAVEAVTNYQATVATDIETNTDGGINHAEQEVVDARGDRSDAERKQSGTRETDGNRSRVSETVGEKGESIQEAESVPGSDRGLSNNKWLLDSNNYIDPAPGSELHKAQSMLTDEYGIECHIVKASEWIIAESPAVTTPDGAVLISEGVDSDDLNAIPTHEATHAMKSKGFKPYLEFIERTPDMLNMSSKEAMRLMQMILEHVGYTLDDITIDDADNVKDRAKKRKRFMHLYDETNAFAYGISVSGQISDSKFDLDWVPNAYNDFDSYIKELSDIHEQFKKENTKQEVKPNVENVDNRSAVQQSDADRQGDSRVLDEVQTDDVQRDAPRGDSVGDAVERGQEAGRDGAVADNGTGAGGRSGDGDRQSGDLRRNDELTPEAEKLHEEVTEQIAQQSTEQPKGRNFVIGDSLDLPNGEKSRYKANIEAIKLVKQLEAEGRYATEAEQVILSKYVGWGGLANAFDQKKADWSKEYTELKELLTEEEYGLARGSTLNAHYTDISVIKAMYDGLAKLGFNGGRMLEPSSGVGNFVGAMPTEMSAKVKSWTMVELDSITGLIAKYLYPNADVRIQGFEKANIPDNYMDVIISNVPFGKYAIADKKYPKKVTEAIHNYFFAKSLDKVRPGGIVMFITSSYTMNAKDTAVRRYIMQRADLLGAIRLPDSAFKGNAGTEVVTDILVLKKRAANTPYAGQDFLEAPWTRLKNESYNGANINSYFTNHPEMVLGTPTMDGGMYRGGSLTYKALEGRGSLADQIREAFSHIEGKMDYPATLSREKTNFAVERANKKTKENGLVVKDGKVYQNKGGELVEVDKAKGAAERITGMLEIRDLARNLMNYQQQGLNDTEIKKARTALNKAYDAFVKKYGFINSQANRNAFIEDPDRYSLFALENWNPETKQATKADIFSKNTIAPNRTVTTAKDVSEGLIVSVNQTGGVDTALIARLTGKTEADVTRELIDSRKAFKNRNGDLEAAETYLSGNVRAKLRDAEALVPIDGDYAHNVEALKAVMPADVGYQDIFVNPGTPWIPNSVYSDFAAYMLGSRNSEWRQAVDITRNAETGNFTVELKDRYLKTNAANTQKWGTSRRTFLELFDAMLNSKSVVIKDKLDDGSFVINKDATAAANEKIENITKEFQEWLWKDEARRADLATLYNEVFNSIVTPKYNGDNLTVNGANALKPLRPHQRNAVQRVISSGGNTLLAHKVGAGKTYEMAAAAMKLKELGLVKKPMFAVPKSLVAQWGNEFIDFFPTAKLLVAEASDFTAANRKVFMNRIANGEYDAVIVSYEQFEKLPMSDDFTRQLYQEQIDSVIAAIEEAKADKGDKALSVKDLEKKRKSLQTKIDKLTDKAKDEGNIDFEQLGVDSLFVDEAHNFKNLFYTTSMTNVAGLGNKDGSKRAFDLYTKVRYLQQLNGGRGIVFATATPVMNSMSEMYIMQKYLQPDLLNQLGLNTFDAWAKQFGEVVNGVEIKPSGQGYRVKQSFSRFKNMSELQLLFRNFADVLTDIPGLKIPKMKGGKVNVIVCEPGQFQQDFMKELEQRADNIKNVDPSVDNMLKITSDGRKISYTQRMIEPSLPYEEGCKIYRCADNVIKEYNDSKANKGTQIIFCDMATPKGKSDNTTDTEDIETDMESAQLYDDLKTRLRQGGIPAKEIAFIHEADTDQKKKKLFADVNDGKVRVLIGSTGKMGVGMNAQKRIVAIHHLDAPWRPGDVEQRDGRAFRQGNINDEVSKYTYVTEGSFDARLWDILDRKQNFINQIMNGESVGRDAEDTGEVTLSAAEVKALASGSPLIMEQVQLDTDIKKLESLYRAHVSAVRSAKERLLSDSGKIATLEKQIANGEADMLATVDTFSEGRFSMTVGNNKYTDKKEAGVALMAAAAAKANPDGYTKVGTFAGFELRVIKTSEGISGLLVGKQGYPFKTYPGNHTYMTNHIIGVVESIDEKVKLWQHNLAELQTDIAEQEKLIAAPFAKQTELDQKRARYNEVMEILNPKEEQSLDGVDEDTVQEQSRAYLGEQDASGNALTAAQSDYFKDSKARDKDGNLLVLYHGTANAGFTVFEPSRGKLGGNWFTTSKKDADSYAGNYKGTLFDPAETDDIRTATGGNYTLGSWMRFDTAEDRAAFLKEHPNAETIKTDAEYDALFAKANEARDWDEYDRLEEEQIENRAELKKIQRAYGRYEWEHSREATLGELFENPDKFTESDVLRAWDAYDTNNAARDEEYTKEDLIAGLKAENDRLLEEDGESIEDLTFKARLPVGESGEIVNRANNRTYAVYANVTKPYVIEAHQRTLAGGNLYPSIAEGLNDTQYDGVIVRDARVGAHQEIGDVVIIKAAEQVKLTSNKQPTADADISYQQRTTTLGDREVLALAADALEATDLTDAERDALQIFRNRLTKLEELQEERAEQGRLYKEQQFGAKVDREAAAQTLNRMHVLDDQIKAAKADVISLEDKKVLGDLLKKARKVVESEQRSHDAEILKRYRDRSRNAAAIKKYRDRITADVEELTKWALKPDNKDVVKHIPDVLKNSVIPFLSSIDFTSKQQLRGGEATKADTAFVERLKKLQNTLREDLSVDDLYSGYIDLPANFMSTLNDLVKSVEALAKANDGKFVINQMTSEELKDLSIIVRTLKTSIANINKFHANSMFAHVYEAGDSTISALSPMSSDNGKANAASNFVFWQQIRPAYAFERFGRGGLAIYDGLRRGQAQLAFNTQKIVAFTDKLYTDKEVNAWEKEVKEIRISAGTVKMRISDMMSLYELSKQPDSLRHMLGEGMRVATYTVNGKKISDNGHPLNEGDVKIIVNELTQRQKEVADAMQKFMAEQGGAWGNEVSVKRFGEQMFTNEQYFPINSDGRHLQATADEHPSNASLYALLNMSFTKSRNEKANNRIIVYSIFDVFANHMASMAQYNAMALPVLDAIRWFNYQQKTEDHLGNRYVKNSVREQMTRVYGVTEETRPGAGKRGYAEDFVLGILKAFNGTEAQGIPADTTFMNTLRRYNMAQVAFNTRVVVQQPLAISRAALLIDYGSIMRGMKLKPAAIKQNIAEMQQYSGIAAWKSLGFYDVNISRGLTDTIKHNTTVGQKIGEIGMWGAEQADTLTWAAMWSACKEEVIKKENITPRDADFYESVAELFEEVIYKTQVVDSILTKNEFLRSKGLGARIAGSFMSEPTTTASMLIDAVDKYHADMKRGMSKQQAWAKNKHMIGRTMYVYAVSAVMLAAVQAIADAWRDDDEYETVIEKWLEAFGGNVIDELMPVNKLPILSDFYDLGKELLSIIGVDTYGNPPTSVYMQWYDSLVKGTQIIYQKIANEDTNYTWYGGIYKLLQAASGIAGLPMAAATREVIAIWNNTVGAMAPSLKLKSYDPGDMSEIKYAYADGYLTFDEAAAELLEKGLVENEDEAYFTVSGWEAGDGYSRYDKVYDAVRTGASIDEAMNELVAHGYTEKDVISQLKSQIGRWYYDDKSDYRISKQQAIDMLTKYTNMTDEEITKKVNEWSCKVVTGIAYGDIADEYMADKITESRAIEMYMRYGGMTKEDATNKVSVYSFIKEHPSLSEESVSYSFVTAYNEYCEPQGIDVNVFHDVWQYMGSAESDKDKHGKVIPDSKKQKVLAYVDSLELSRRQKDALYYALGYAKSTIKDAPWH